MTGGARKSNQIELREVWRVGQERKKKDRRALVRGKKTLEEFLAILLIQKKVGRTYTAGRARTSFVKGET